MELASSSTPFVATCLPAPSLLAPFDGSTVGKDRAYPSIALATLAAAATAAASASDGVADAVVEPVSPC